MLANHDTLVARIEKQEILISADSTPGMVRSLEESRSHLIQVEKDINAQYPELASMLSVNASSLKQIQQNLESEVKIIEYFLSDEVLYIWFIGKDNFQGVSIQTSKSNIASLITACRNLIKLKDDKELSELTHELYQLLISPISEHLQLGDKLCIVPHDALHYLPFQIIRNEDRYLGEIYSIFYVPSASVFDYCKLKRSSREMSLLAFGNPDLNDPAMAIPFAEKEVMELKKLYPTSMIYTGKDADKKAFMDQSENYKLIHMATHGIFSLLNPMRSGLLMAGDTLNTQLLTTSQIFNCHLNAYLVTLSACQTAIGKRTGGDELISLTRAFLYAGTPSVVSSLWNVNDESTAFLMVKFYKNLEQMDKATALQLAQLETMKEYPHPFYWGAFILNGDWL
jgi:CHAT domain-containing protein